MGTNDTEGFADLLGSLERLGLTDGLKEMLGGLERLGSNEGKELGPEVGSAENDGLELGLYS